jgi:hypothetical protein
LPKKGEFETKTPAFGSMKVPGVIPPFGPKIGVVEVIPWKFEVVAG